MKRSLYIAYTLLLAVPVWAYAQTSIVTSSDTLKTLVTRLLKLMDTLVWPLIGLCIVFFFYGLIRYIYKSGDAKGRTLGREVILWSLVGMFVIFSLWGIVNFISATLLGVTPNGVNQVFYVGQPGYSSGGTTFKANDTFKATDHQPTNDFKDTNSFQPQ